MPKAGDCGGDPTETGIRDAFTRGPLGWAQPFNCADISRRAVPKTERVPGNRARSIPCPIRAEIRSGTIAGLLAGWTHNPLITIAPVAPNNIG